MTLEVTSIKPISGSQPDHAFIVPASWEERCLTASRMCGQYECDHVILSEYDRPSARREKHIALLKGELGKLAPVESVTASYDDPLPNVRRIVELVRAYAGSQTPRISVDISTFTKKH